MMLRLSLFLLSSVARMVVAPPSAFSFNSTTVSNGTATEYGTGTTTSRATLTSTSSQTDDQSVISGLGDLLKNAPANLSSYCLSVQTERYYSFISTNTSSYTPAFTTPCCFDCSVVADRAHAIYWPTPAPRLNMSTIVGPDGFTFTSPSVYIILDHVRALGLCTPGTAIPHATLAFDEKAISTRNLGYLITPINFADLNSCSTTTSIQSDQFGYEYNACLPSLIFESNDLRSLQPAWSSCVKVGQLIFDPPSALTSATALSGPNLDPPVSLQGDTTPTHPISYQGETTPATMGATPEGVPKPTGPTSNLQTSEDPKLGFPTLVSPTLVSNDPTSPVSVPNRPNTPVPILGNPTVPAPVSNNPAAPIPISNDPSTPGPVVNDPLTPVPVANNPTTPLPVANDPTTPLPVSSDPKIPVQASSNPTTKPIVGVLTDKSSNQVSGLQDPAAIKTDSSVQVIVTPVITVVGTSTITVDRLVSSSYMTNPQLSATLASEHTSGIPVAGDGGSVTGNSNSATKSTDYLFTKGTSTFTANPDSITIQAIDGSKLTTDGIAVSVGNSPNGAGSIPFTKSEGNLFAIGTNTLTINSDNIALGNTKLTINGPPLTVDGVMVSLGSSVLVIGSKTETFVTPTTSTGEGLAGLIMSGFGQVGGVVATTDVPGTVPAVTNASSYTPFTGAANKREPVVDPMFLVVMVLGLMSLFEVYA